MDPIEGIVQFNLDRGLTDFCPTAEYKMLFEELQEFLMAAAQDDTHEMVDALCDVIVVAVGGLSKLGYAPDTALQETVKEIRSRNGSFNSDTGKWEKDRNQDPSTLYKADYTKAKR
jgi:phosphoribosyl-ATP pyrophosphohydrolase